MDNKRAGIVAIEGGFRLRIYKSKAKSKPARMAKIRIKCGCCRGELIIAYDEQTLEIGSVMASIEEWRSVLQPLLYPEK